MAYIVWAIIVLTKHDLLYKVRLRQTLGSVNTFFSSLFPKSDVSERHSSEDTPVGEKTPW